MRTRFTEWRQASTPRLTAFDKDAHPKALIQTIAEDLLDRFRAAPLLDAYDIYQHLMDSGRRPCRTCLPDRRRRLGRQACPHRRNR